MCENMYVPIHMHSMLSNGTTNIDSITNFREYVSAAENCGMKAMAITEHGNIFEWVHKKEAIENSGMKYIHAVEAYLTEELYHGVGDIDAQEVLDINKSNKKQIRDNYHCILIAKNYDGVKEINSLVSRSYNRNDGHFYYVPRISFEELFSTSDNVIITTACLGGVLHNANTNAKEKFLGFIIKNKHRCYLEIQHHDCEEQIEYNRMLYELSKAFDIPLIVGTDTHALNEEHMEGRSILQKSKNVFFENEKSWDLTFKTPDQLLEAYRNQNSLPMSIIIMAMDNSVKLAESVEEFKLDYSAKYPKLYENPEIVFSEKIKNGIKWRGLDKLDNFTEYKDRIRYEYETYKHNNAIDFMLLEEDYKSEMRRRGVRFGYSRGSVSGSVIAYILGITEVDSVKFGLNFERFMNKERVSLADIDTDWLSEDRKIVKDYLYKKDGLYCCDIVTFNTIAIKGAIRDVGRALQIPLDEVSDICENVDLNEQKLREKYKELFRYVDLVNGVVVSVGNHPAGCVVSPYPVDEWFGTFTTSTDEYPISILNMKEIDSLNFVKLDILGLDNIGLIYKTCDAAGIPFATPDNIPPDDLNVWKSIREDTTMIFQWESQSATAYLKQLMSDETIENIRKKNNNFSYMDLLSIGNGAIRPAGESYRDKLAQGIYQDNGHEALNRFLSPTLGYLVYQEQIIEFLHSFCGYTMGEADIVRRGFAKKTGTDKFIPQIKSGFTRTMMDKYGVSQSESDVLIVAFIKVIEDASAYLFSKNHADPYSWIGYICGYLRYYYPLEFITSALNIFEGKEEKSTAIIQYAKKQGIKIYPIKFRHSVAHYNFSKDNNAIYKGISSIKYMNSIIADELYELRDINYSSFMELLWDLKSTSINARQLEILIKLEFFSEFGNVGTLLEQYKVFCSFHTQKKFKKQIKKSLLLQLEIPEESIRRIAKKETPLMFIEVQPIPFLNIAAQHVKDVVYPLRERIASQIEYLGYIDFYGSEYAGLGVVLDIDTKYTPRANIYSLKNGNIISCKISKRDYNRSKISKGDIIKITGTTRKPRQKRTASGSYETIPNEFDLWITKYTKTML